MIGGRKERRGELTQTTAASSRYRQASRNRLAPKRLTPKSIFARSAFGTTFDNRKDLFIEGGYLAGANDSLEEQSWRITTRVSARGNLQYGEVLDTINAAIDRQLKHPDGVADETAAEYARVSILSTGMMPLVHVAQTALLHDLFVSFLTALLVVSIVMVIVLRSVVVGVMAMIPNIFPTAILFGTMGWLDKPVDIGSMMTASVALGMAVDGTLHYLTWFRRELDNGHAPSEAIGLSFRHCAMAMTQTTIICGLGLLVFSLSAFVPTQRFAWMMFALLLAALVGDLILLPALLVGPFRGLMTRRVAGSKGEPVS